MYFHTSKILWWSTSGKNMFKTELKNINDGIRVNLTDKYNSKTYKLFYRKEV